MKRHSLWLLVAILLVGGWVFAQDENPVMDDAISPQDFGYLLRIGDDARVHTADGSISGRVEFLDATQIRIDDEIVSTVDVWKIERRDNDSIGNGALIGLGIGAGFALLACTNDCDSAYVMAGLLTFGAAGAGIGALIDSAKKGYTTIYVGSEQNKTLSFAPLITPDKKGVAVSFSF